MTRSMQHELKQRKPFASVEEEAFLAVLRTADQLDRRNTEMLKPFGLSPTQYNALRILRGARPAGLPCSEIGDRMINRDPDITRLMDRLQKRGLVIRSRGERDRRVVRARITSSGLQLLQQADEPVREFVGNLLGHMAQSQLRSLIKLLAEARR